VKNQHSRQYDANCQGAHVALGHGFRHEIVALALWFDASKFVALGFVAPGCIPLAFDGVAIQEARSYNA